MDTTLYGVLGVAQGAEKSDIVSAYREKVKTHHPDVSDAPDARAQFKRIRTAKEVLTDDDERARYDEIGHDTYVRRHLDADVWDLTAATTGAASAAAEAATASSKTAKAATASSSDVSSGGHASRRQYQADGGGAAAYYQPGQRIGATHRGQFDRLSNMLFSVGPLLVAHLCLLFATAGLSGWLLFGGTNGIPTVTSTILAMTVVGITGTLSLLHLSVSLSR